MGDGDAPATGEVAGRARLPGGQLAYAVRGSGTALVLVHGFTLDRRIWEPQVAALAARHRVLSYDCRGFGTSSEPAPGVPYTHSGDLCALLEVAGMHRAALVGSSMGGQIALETAIEHPERVEQLVLVGPWVAGLRYAQAWKALWKRIAERTAAGDVEGARRTWLRSALFASAGRNPRAARLLEQVIGEYSGWHFRHPAHFPYIDVSARLGEIAVPVLVVVGEEDLPEFRAVAERLSEAIPGARRLVLAGAGHLAALERPAAFNQVVMAFRDR